MVYNHLLIGRDNSQPCSRGVNREHIELFILFNCLLKLIVGETASDGTISCVSHFNGWCGWGFWQGFDAVSFILETDLKYN